MREGGWRNGYPVWPENGVVSPGARVKSYEVSDMSTPEKNLCSLGKQQVLLTTEQCLWHLYTF